MVEIFGTSWCSACQQAKKLCEVNGTSYVYVDVDDSGELKKLEERLGTQVKQVPQIFLNGVHLQNGMNSLREELNKK